MREEGRREQDVVVHAEAGGLQVLCQCAQS